MLNLISFITAIDPVHKSLPIENSFVNSKISPTNLVFELTIQKNFYSQMRLVGLIETHTKEFEIGSNLCIGSITVFPKWLALL